jgi:predicted Zn-dependent peptidase
MVKFEKFILNNGLKVLVNTDEDTPLVAFNLLYNVGAKDEEHDKTGFAHLFEHLMFGGSKNVPSYDEPLQLAGGENNAFTNNDITNYYITLPKENIETAFWIESDRMLELDFSEKSLQVQQNVVIEEYKQRYLNQPYGDVWLKLRPLAYKAHPYMWPTIGKDISHIQNANLEDVRQFFYRHYAPDNAILGISGNITPSEVKYFCEKWFAPIKARNIPLRNLPTEPIQNDKRKLTMKGNVPFDAIYKVYHSCSRIDKDYPSSDLISDLLSGGKSSRLYNHLVQEKRMFSELDAYITGDIEPGLFVISGKLMKGIKPEDAEN